MAQIKKYQENQDSSSNHESIDNSIIEDIANYFQSCRINFLVGSVASLPAIKTLRNIENKIDSLLTSNQEDLAKEKLQDFIQPIAKVNCLLLSEKNNVKQTT